MKLKKHHIIFSIFLIFIATSLKLSHPQLIPTGKTILKLISKQERKADCTCWSTVRIMEFHQAKQRLSYHATALKVEAMKALLLQIWFESSQSNLSLEKYIETKLNIKIGELNKDIPSKYNQALDHPRLQKYYYHQLTEHYRYLLSTIYEISERNLNPREFNELNKKEIELLAKVSTHLNYELLNIASKNAINKRHFEIMLTDIKKAYTELLSKLNLSTKKPTTKKTDLRYFLWLKHFSKTISKNKKESLKQYNQSIWSEDITIRHQAKLLSTIFDYDIKPKELEIVFKHFIENYRWLFFPLKINEYNYFQNPLNSNQKTNKKDYGYKVLNFKTEFNFLLKAFPFYLKQNGDIDVSYKNFNSKLDIDIFQDEKTINVRSYVLDSVRDTIVHWELIEQIQKNFRPAILDPFALEILAERISEYIAVIISISKKTGLPFKENISNNNLFTLKFFQINNAPAEWTLSNPDTPKKYFKESNNIETIIIERNDTKIDFGYFSGISSADLNNDSWIDIIVPGDFFIDVLINKSENSYKRKRIFEKEKTYFSSAYAIDYNEDYKLDIIGVGNNGIYFLKQTQPFTFELDNFLDLKFGFTLCANDIDNDEDIDIYVTQTSNTFFSLGGKSAEPNKLIINNKSKFNFKENQFIESQQISLACSILDLNNDQKNDIFVINDFGRDQLFIQEDNLKFTNQAEKYNVDDSGAGMNLSIVDFNNDSFWDAYITIIDAFNKQFTFHLPMDDTLLSINEEVLKTNTFLIGNQLYIGNKDNTFSRQTTQIIEPGLKGWGWGTTFFDYDNDSDKDIYITNGATLIDLKDIGKESNIFMLNKSGKLFYSNSTSEESKSLNSRAVVAVDTNNDGKLDLWVRTPGGAIEFKNTKLNLNSFLKIKLIGKKPNTFAIGAIIEVITDKKTMKEIILPQTGYLSQEPYLKHFGINNQKIKNIKITWPDQLESIIPAPKKLNQTITIKHPKI